MRFRSVLMCFLPHKHMLTLLPSLSFQERLVVRQVLSYLSCKLMLVDKASVSSHIVAKFLVYYWIFMWSCLCIFQLQIISFLVFTCQNLRLKFFTCWQVYYYYPFSALSDPAKLYNDLRWNITRPQGFEAVMRVRCSQASSLIFWIFLCSKELFICWM